MQRTISKAVQGTEPQTKARMQALASVRWLLATDDGQFVTVDDKGKASLIRDPAKAAIYDGRDNEKIKLRFMETLLGVPLTVVLMDK